MARILTGIPKVQSPKTGEIHLGNILGAYYPLALTYQKTLNNEALFFV